MTCADRIRLAAHCLQCAELATGWSLKLAWRKLAWRKRALAVLKGL